METNNLSDLKHRLYLRREDGLPILEVVEDLSRFKGSAIIFDLSGQYYQLTDRKQNDKEIIINPFKVSGGGDEEPISYNPLYEISHENVEQTLRIISAISDSCVWETDTPENNSHWSHISKLAISALIGHVVTRFPKEQHTLPFIFDFICETGLTPTFINDMINNNALNGHIQEVGNILSHIGKNEKNALDALLHKYLNWAGDSKIRKHLSGLDFSFQAFGLQNEKLTTYVIFPAEALIKPTWLKMILSTGLTILMTRKKQPEVPVVFMVGQITDYQDQIEKIATCYSFPVVRSMLQIFGSISSVEELKNTCPVHWKAILNNVK